MDILERVRYGSQTGDLRLLAIASWLPVLFGAAAAYTELPGVATVGGFVWFGGILFQLWVGAMWLQARRG